MEKMKNAKKENSREKNPHVTTGPECVPLPVSHHVLLLHARKRKKRAWALRNKASLQVTCVRSKSDRKAHPRTLLGADGGWLYDCLNLAHLHLWILT